MSAETPQYVDVNTPNASQIRSAVRGAENYRYYQRRRSTWWIRLLFYGAVLWVVDVRVSNYVYRLELVKWIFTIKPLEWEWFRH